MNVSSVTHILSERYKVSNSAGYADNVKYAYVQDNRYSVKGNVMFSDCYTWVLYKCLYYCCDYRIVWLCVYMKLRSMVGRILIYHCLVREYDIPVGSSNKLNHYCNNEWKPKYVPILNGVW